jgi:hypothetical protein
LYSMNIATVYTKQLLQRNRIVRLTNGKESGKATQQAELQNTVWLTTKQVDV